MTHDLMKQSIRVVVIDDHPLYRKGVVRALQDDGRFDVVAEGGDGETAIRLALDLRPSLILLDISMPGNGIEAARIIATRVPAANIAMLTASETDTDILSALEVGAKGYILKGVGADELLTVAVAVANGESYVSPGLAARLLTDIRTKRGTGRRISMLDVLTAREVQILRLVSDGLSNKEVARRLSLQEKTIKHYMTNVLQKLQVRNRTEAAVLAKGLLEMKGGAASPPWS